jgi:uncharacterized protein
MTTLAAAVPARRSLRLSAPRVYAAATALAGLHLLTAAVVEGGQALLPLGLAVAVAASFSRLRPGIQAWTSFAVGALLAADAALHVAHALRPGASLTFDDATGLVSGVGGVVLLALAARLAFRAKARRPVALRWGARVAALAGTAASVVFVVMPVSVAVYLLHKQPVHVPTTALGIPHQDVTLRTSDGVALAAWFVPSRNGAAVVLVHGSGGDRSGGIESRAVMLARHGYGVLLYDARGSGDSGGRPENMGWTWHRDAAAAVDFLRARGIQRIGALGLSTGAETAIEAAGRDPRIGAVVAEGAQARSLSELRLLPKTAGNELFAAYWGTVVTAYRVLSLESPPPSLASEVARIAPRPVFLISSGKDFERALNRVYAARARGPVTLWELPATEHTGGLAAHPRAYDRRVTAFFDRALLR